MDDTTQSPSPVSLLFMAPPPLPEVPEIEIDDPFADPGPARRTRGRRGGQADAAPASVQQGQQSQPSQQSTRQRTPRQAPEPITEPQRIKGSTRLEAKKQRRRDGRTDGRRRTVVTESEFLARREAVDRAMVVRSKFDRIQVAVLEDDVLVEHYVAKS